MIGRLLCRLGFHRLTGFSINAHWHDDETMWMSLICARCLRHLDHHQVPKGMYR